MSMDIEDDVCDTGLVLGLGYNTKTSIGSRRDPPLKSEPTASNIPKPIEPSLTLGSLARQSLSPHSPLSSTFTSAFLSSAKRENESDGEEDGGNTRKKLRLTKEQSALLEDKFREHSTLIPKQKQALAKQLNLRPRQVEVWFQNRRARTKLKQTEEDCEFLKRCCEKLSNENRRLHKELQELKALRSTPSKMYTHLPSSIRMVCPSCERAGGARDRTTNGKPFCRGAA